MPPRRAVELHGDDVELLPWGAGDISAVRAAGGRRMAGEDAFGQQETCSKLEVCTRRTHRHGDPMRRLSRPGQPDLQGFLSDNGVRASLHLAIAKLSDGAPNGG